MRLDRKINPNGMGKYELYNNRKKEIVYDCKPNQEHEFFVIMLKDRHARKALVAYANSIKDTDPDFAYDVMQLANRSGIHSKWCKEPD